MSWNCQSAGRQYRAVFQGREHGAELSDGLDARPAVLAPLERIHGRNGHDRLSRGRCGAGRVHWGQPVVCAGRRPVGRVDEFLCPGVHFCAAGRVGRLCLGRVGRLFAPGRAGDHAAFGRGADHSRLCLSAAHPVAVRVRSGCRAGGVNPVRLSAHGAQHHAGPAWRADGGRGIRTDVGRDQAATVLAGAISLGLETDPDRGQSDHHGVSVDGHHRVDHRRNGRYRMGSAVDNAQGAVRRKPDRGYRHCPDGDDIGPDHLWDGRTPRQHLGA